MYVCLWCLVQEGRVEVWRLEELELAVRQLPDSWTLWIDLLYLHSSYLTHYYGPSQTNYYTKHFSLKGLTGYGFPLGLTIG